MISRILVPVRGDGMGETVISHAAAIARRHAARVVVAHCRAQPEDLMPYGVPLPAFARETILRQAHAAAEEQESQLREDLHRLAMRLGLDESGAQTPGTASVEFVEERGKMADVIKHFGRLADLIVVAKPDRDRNIGTNSLKSALFQTGRPVLMCPRTGEPPADLGARIAVGWNGSLESSRAVALTLDLAQKAEHVTILSGGKGEPHGATMEELVEYYRLRGIAPEATRFDSRNPGAALLEHTTAAGATMLVMGAYGHSHERETIFGGNTQTVVDRSEIPVVLVH